MLHEPLSTHELVCICECKCDCVCVCVCVCVCLYEISKHTYERNVRLLYQYSIFRIRTQDIRRVSQKLYLALYQKIYKNT